MHVVYFNSIKVRLELLAVVITSEIEIFQFHKGTIRTASAGGSGSGTLPFQFHKGTIRTRVHEMGNTTDESISIP